MGTRKTRELPAALAAAQRAFQQWRESRQGRRRIPESLWAVAVEAAGQFGINRTAKALRIDHGRLKKHVLAQTDSGYSEPCGEAGTPTFMELPSALRLSCGPCVVELEDRAGGKMRIEVVKLDTPDLVALARSFWEA